MKASFFHKFSSYLAKLVNKSKIYQRYNFRVSFYNRAYRIRIQQIREKEHANVVFIAANLSMWRYQGLYCYLSKDSRFTVTVVIAPFQNFVEIEQKRHETELISYFQKHEVSYVTLEELPKDSYIKSLNPDIIFYPQPYCNYGTNIDYQYFRDVLLAYYPYGLQSLYLNWGYNLEFHNIVWRLYYPTNLHLNNAKKLSANNGKNVRVVGEPNYDRYLSSTLNPWKCEESKKKIIWAPHYQIEPNEMFYRPSFMWTYQLMVDIARLYKDRLHIAFKPHPKLFSTLCHHPEWGEERTKEYYKLWETMSNTQLETGDFIDLFVNSDALIHDCGSFTSEYQYTKKPCMFLTREDETLFDTLCPFGRKCMDNHYIGHSKEEIVDFIEKVVFQGVDKKATQRECFYNDYLLPPNNLTTAENTYNDLVASIFG